MLRFKLITHTLDPDDMVWFAKVARVKQLNRSSLLGILVSNFLRKEARKERAS